MDYFTASNYASALQKIVYEVGDFDYHNALEHDILVECITRSDKTVLWYLDDRSMECCVYLDTAEELTKEEIEKELL